MRFVAWLNGLSVFQIKVSNKYAGDDFDDDLHTVLRHAGCKGKKDKSNVLDSGFLERMDTLLANAKVPGLFEGDEHAALMTACKEGSQRDGLMLDSHEELYRWFAQQVAKDLHVVFTMNLPENGLASRAATSLHYSIVVFSTGSVTGQTKRSTKSGWSLRVFWTWI